MLIIPSSWGSQQCVAVAHQEAFYAIHHTREFVRDQDHLMLPSSLPKWGQDLANVSDTDLRLELYRIQEKLAQLINKEGMFYYGAAPPTKEEIESRLEMQSDDRPFNTLGGVLPFPPRSSQK